jgi:hypothetical protein
MDTFDDDFYAAVKGLRLRLIAEIPNLLENNSNGWGNIFVETFKVFNLPEPMLDTMGTTVAFTVIAYNEVHNDSGIEVYVHRLIRGLSWHLRSLVKLDDLPLAS